LIFGGAAKKEKKKGGKKKKRKGKGKKTVIPQLCELLPH